MRCGFCGNEFDAAEAEAACAGCPIAREGCQLLRCPHCGYEMPPEAKLVGWLRNLRRRFAGPSSRPTAEIDRDPGN